MMKTEIGFEQQFLTIKAILFVLLYELKVSHQSLLNNVIFCILDFRKQYILLFLFLFFSVLIEHTHTHTYIVNDNSSDACVHTIFVCL